MSQQQEEGQPDSGHSVVGSPGEASTVREAFERWYSDDGASPKAIERNAGGGYKLLQACNAWTAWHAASASKDAEIQRLREALEEIAAADHPNGYFAAMVRVALEQS